MIITLASGQLLFKCLIDQSVMGFFRKRTVWVTKPIESESNTVNVEGSYTKQNIETDNFQNIDLIDNCNVQLH